MKVGEVKEKNYVNYIVIKLLYNANTKKDHEKFFIAPITFKKSIDILEVNFIRKKGIVYHFPEKLDFHTINRTQIVQTINFKKFKIYKVLSFFSNILLFYISYTGNRAYSNDILENCLSLLSSLLDLK